VHLPRRNGPSFASLPPRLRRCNHTRTLPQRHGGDAAVNGGRTARPPVGGVGGATSGRLAAMAVVERHSRPMMHHLARCLLEPSLRQDALTLTQVRLCMGMGAGANGARQGRCKAWVAWSRTATWL
jgi:hypothetical protein